MRWRRDLAIVLAVLGLAGCAGGSGPSFVGIVGRLPVLHGTTLDGNAFGPADYRGKILVVNFWNQECPPCLEEAPVLEQARRDLAARGVEFVGVLYRGGGWPDDPSAARRFLVDHGVTYPTIVDRSSDLARALGVVGIPTTVVVDRSGALRFKLLGRVRPGQIEGVVDRLG